MHDKATSIPADQRRRLHLLIFLCPAVFLLITAIVLAAVPQVDIAVAGIFYAQNHFVGDTPEGRIARELGRLLPFVLLISLILMWIAGKLGLCRSIALQNRDIVWLVLSMALGPGLLVDGLKEVSHRPRPVHVRDFGGRDEFRSFYRFDGACPHNCSFPSGEASAAFWTLVPASLAPPPLRFTLLAAAATFGLATGGLRMAFGAHFLSDVFFAAILTLAIALALRRLKPLSSQGSRIL
jgi:lipid A 4'-phosphatase